MLVAALDTATLTLSAALLEVGTDDVTLLAERTEHQPPRAPGGAIVGHSARLPSVISDLLVACDLKLPDVEGYAIGLGPGSFTGLRIGLATLKGLAYANQRPIAGVSSLAAMAAEAGLASAPGGGPAEQETLLVPLLDAKKNEVYAGFYRATPEGLGAVRPDAALSPAALLEQLAVLRWTGPVLAFGEGYEAHAAAFGGALAKLPAAVRTPGAPAVGRLAAAALRGAGFDQQRLSALEPHYVRASEAEVKFPNGLPPRPLG
jgi:tRNA threonylcarbamoyladenosine biosynthesis protein TsaB